MFDFVPETINVEFFESINQDENLFGSRCLVKAVIHEVAQQTLEVIDIPLEIDEVVVEFSLKSKLE